MSHYKTFIIAEAGVNHNGSPEVARKLVDVAVEAGGRNPKSQFSMRHALCSIKQLCSNIPH